MKKAVIIYNSKTGTTKKFSDQISDFCRKNSIETKVVSIEEYNSSLLENIDYLFLGCWTQGLFFFAQHPPKEWISFAGTLPALQEQKIILFTTYKFAVGSLFNKMKKYLKCFEGDIIQTLQSRTGDLLNNHIEQLKTCLS